MQSTVAIMENYDTAMAGVTLHYEYSKNHLDKTFPKAGIPVPVKLCLNTRSIVDVQRAI